MSLRPVCAALEAALLVALLLTVAACGGGGSSSAEPFEIDFPPAPPGGGSTPPTTPPPAPPAPPVFDADAFVHRRVVTWGGFPSDVLVHRDTVFTTDGDQITADGSFVVPVDVSGAVPVASTRFQPVRIAASDLVDSQGNPVDVAVPIAFGFFVNDLEVVGDRLAFALVNAGGSDSTPTLSNVVAFDPTEGRVLQTVDLTHSFTLPPGRTDSSGIPVPAAGFVQAAAEALEYVPDGPDAGRLFVVMTNLQIAPPSLGTVKFPGTVQVYDVSVGDARPVRARPRDGLVTETLDVGGFNPVAVLHVPVDVAPGDPPRFRLLVTVAGATAYDASFRLVPATDASVAAYDASTGGFLGRFALGKVGLSASRPALGRDAAGHRVGFFPSAVTGEVYLLRLDGLYAPTVDVTTLAVLRGPKNGIPITPALAGGPGGNVTGVGLAPDGRTLVVAGFGDLFALPAPRPGELYLLNLPEDLVTGAGFGVNFVPGATRYGTAAGRTLGALALVPNDGSRPDVYVAVSSPMDTTAFQATGPASLGSLQTFGLLR